MEEQKITVELVREIARLSGVAIPEERLQTIADAFNAALPLLNRLMALDLKDVEPTYYPRHRLES